MNILFIEDDIEDQFLIQRAVSEDMEIQITSSIQEAFLTAEVFKPEVIVSDLSLPDARGFETISRIREHFPNIPLVVLTGLDDEKTALDAVKAGTQDYLAKEDLNKRLLARVIQYAKYRNEKIQELEEQKQDLSYKASHDPLTGLYNRRYALNIGELWMSQFHRDASEFGCIMIDIDNFKTINDSFGHQTGDEVLQGLADCLMENTRASDIVCRYGGEEFVVLLQENHTTIEQLAAKLLSNIRKLAFSAEDETLNITVSIGLSFFQYGDSDVRALIHRADHGLYKAKHNGKDQIAQI